MLLRTTRELVSSLKSIEPTACIDVVLVDISDQAHAYLHDDCYANARKLFTLDDLCGNVYDYDALFESVTAKTTAETPKEMIEDAFVEALEFSDGVRDHTSVAIKGMMEKSNGYAVTGVSCRGKLVMGLFR